MKQEDRYILGLTEEQAEKLNANVKDAFYTIVNKMCNKEIGDFSEKDILVYLIAKRDILKNHKDINTPMMSRKIEDIKEEMRETIEDLFETYKEYKEVKHKYSKISNSNDKNQISEAHRHMKEALNKMLNYIDELFSDLYSCSECEDERIELNKTIRNLVKKYNIN